MWQQLLEQINIGDNKVLARAISFVENEQPGYENLLAQLTTKHSKIIGITGPPGAGKSTLVDGIIREIIDEGKKVAVLCVDPSSPFNLGALLGDRIRMNQWYNNPNVFIRSLATRGALGGLHPKIIEITDLAKAAGFDYIIIETVGVGQSEIEIAGLADVTVVVLVPEAGDEIQTMKAGLMEIADIFVVNKSDRPDADVFVKYLGQMLAPAFANDKQEVAIVKTVAHEGKGLNELMKAVKAYGETIKSNEKKAWLLAEKVYQIIQQRRMKDISKELLFSEIAKHKEGKDFNIFKFAQSYGNNS